jgi:hypothetical protein
MKVRVEVAAALVHCSVELPASNVRFVVVVISQAEPTPVSDHVPLPILRVRTPVPVPENAVEAERLTLLLLTEKSSVPVNAPIVIDCTLIVVLT